MGAFLGKLAPMLLKGGMQAAKSPMGRGAMLGYSVGRNKNLQQGQADGAPKNESLEGWFPGR